MNYRQPTQRMVSFLAISALALGLAACASNDVASSSTIKPPTAWPLLSWTSIPSVGASRLLRIQRFPALSSGARTVSSSGCP